MLHRYIETHRAEIIARTRARAARRPAPSTTAHELESDVSLFVEQLAAALRGHEPSAQEMQAIGVTAAIHGGRLLHQGFTISQVVHGYSDVCQVLTELAQEDDAAITTEEFHTLNRCLDEATAEAVTEYTRLRGEAISEEGIVRAGVLAHELRNRLSAAKLGFELIRSGSVAPGGSVAALVNRSHTQMAMLIQRSLVEVRLTVGLEYRERVSLAALIEEAEVDGALEAKTRNQAFTVTPVDRGVELNVDRQIVAGAIANLMQNAFKFTFPGGHVFLRAGANDRCVQIEIEDECGGLPPGKAEELFGAFEQHGEDRSGLGLGLYISRKGIEANDGVLGVEDVPGHGCIFRIELPRVPSLTPGL